MARVRLNHAHLRITAQGEGMQLIRKVLLDVEFHAKIKASVGPYATGRLSNSIERDGPHLRPGGRITGTVGSDLDYASAAHDGARIHPIFPKSARGVYRFGSRTRPQLRFFWRKRGAVVYMPHVPGSIGRVGLSHPGMKGKQYLADPLWDAAHRYNMSVVIYP